MRNGTYYLNNTESRAKTFVDGKVEQKLLFHGAEGYCKMRAPLCEEVFGNWNVYVLRYNSKNISCIPTNINGKVVCFVDSKEKY